MHSILPTLQSLMYFFQDDGSGAAAAGAAAFIFLIFAVVFGAIFLVVIASLWKVFVKAGKPGWAAIVPIYNLIVLLDIVDKPVWYIVLILIPGVGPLVLTILINLELAKKFGKEMGFAIGLIILPIVFLPMLAFGDAQYRR